MSDNIVASSIPKTNAMIAAQSPSPSPAATAVTAKIMDTIIAIIVGQVSKCTENLWVIQNS